MHDERRTVERQLVLATDAVDVCDRKCGLKRPAANQLVALVVLVELVGAAVGHEQHLGARVCEMGADDVLPDVLADRHADLHALELDRLGQRTRREDALLVERAVVRQLALERPAEHPAAVGEDHRVISEAALRHRSADQDRRPRLGRRGNELVGAFMRAADKLGLQHQVLGRIADQLQFRAEQQVGTLRPAPHLEHRRGIAFEVADPLVHLGERNAEAIGHAGDLATIRRGATFTRPRLAR